VPTYDYECGSCRFRFERKHRFDEEPVVICPQCEGKARRVIHSVPVIFKGSGFYVNDSRSGGAIEEADKTVPSKKKRKGK